jgi:hypothetical protein
MLVVAVTGVLTAYVVTYYRLSRRGMREAAELEMPGFVYVSAEDTTEKSALSIHTAFMVFYAPLNWLDRKLLGTPGPTICFMRLSG